MSTPTPSASHGSFQPQHFMKRQLYVIGVVSGFAVITLLLWPRLTDRLLTTDFLPHAYCYLQNSGLVWTNVAADSLIAIAYLAISVTLIYLGYKGRYDIPFPWMFVIFGFFIVACAATHFMEVVTVWIPVYFVSAAVKLFTAAVSVAAATVLPFTVPQVFALVQQAKTTQQMTEQLRASEDRKDALLQEVHHRVKNNLTVICSLFYLQSTHTKDEEAIRIFRDMERRVHSMALVHESLYRSEGLERIDFADYARTLSQDILSSHGGLSAQVRMRIELETVMMGVDLAVLCGLILNELMVNSFKHGFNDRAKGEIKLTLHRDAHNQCTLSVEDDGVGIPPNLTVETSKTMGLRLVRSLTRQIRGSFELSKRDRGTSACLRFKVDQHEQ